MMNSEKGAPFARVLAVMVCALVVVASECPVDDNTPAGGNGGGSSTTPTPTTLSVTGGNDQTGTAGAILPTALTVRVDDQTGAAMSGVGVTFAVTTGGGTLESTSATTGSDGQASTTWTLGAPAGSQQVSASVSGISTARVFNATATADAASAIDYESGNGQNGFPNTALGSPIVVAVTDQYGNAVADQEVTFTVLSGGGSISPGTDTTDADGNAQATWTLGASMGVNTAEASATGLTGSPVSFAANATNLSITAVSPSPLVEGSAATITGTGFDLTPGNNTVTVDGVAANVTAVASATSMTITVPDSDCRPQRTGDVVVSVSTFNATSPGLTIQPQNQLSLSVGEQVIIENPSEFCLQLPASGTGNDEYLIGVGSVSEAPSQTMPFLMTGVAGVSAAPPAMLQRPTRASVSYRPPAGTRQFEIRQRHAEVEARVREFERRHLDPNSNPNVRYLRGRAMGEASVLASPAATADTLGHQRNFRVPNINEGGWSEITATVRKVGTSGIWYFDDANPTVDSLTQADIDTASDLFDTSIYPFATSFFGAPSDIDNNSKIIVVMTKEVNLTGAAGFVHSCDLVERAGACMFSDSAEIFYGFVPDPSGDYAGTYGQPYDRDDVTDFLPVLIAHEFTHNIQSSRRTVLASGGFPAIWIAEGQATLAEEVVGYESSSGAYAAGGNHGSSVATAGPPFWFWQGITKLGYYLGHPSVGGAKLSNTPEDCTLFGDFSGNIGVCSQSAFYGASWSMLRYLTDRFYSSNPSSFHQEIISANPTLRGVENIEEITGMSFDSLFAQWGAMLYVDDRVNPTPNELSMTSWNLPDVLSAVGATASLDPVEHPFGAFSDSRSVRGGSHAYTLISAAGARPAFAVRIRDAADDVLGAASIPIVWIVRTQ